MSNEVSRNYVEERNRNALVLHFLLHSIRAVVYFTLGNVTPRIDFPEHVLSRQRSVMVQPVGTSVQDGGEGERIHTWR